MDVALWTGAPSLRGVTARRLLIALAIGSTPAFVQSAHAEAPVNQCTDAGQSASTDGGAGSGFSPGPNIALPTALGSSPNTGTVSPKTGVFAFTDEDLSLGTGSFPAKLVLQRTYSSDQDGPPSLDYDRDIPYEPGARQPMSFGRGATHNLNVTFQQTVQSFGGQFYVEILIKMGPQSVAFQKCADGTFVNSRADGSRLFVDSTYSNGGYRYESRTGDVLLFQALPPQSTGVYYCSKSSTKCGVLRKWISPNGDWAQFDYEQFYSHPSNRAETNFVGWATVNQYNNSGTVECHPNFSGASECHQRMTPTYYNTYIENSGGISSFPVYNWRLIKVSNSRGYEFRFQYVDATTDQGGTCISSNGSFACSTAKNVGLGRSRIQSVSGYWTSPSGVSTQINQASYTYSDCEAFAPDCLATVTGPDGGVTTYSYSYGATNSLSITPPGYAAPVTTLTFALGQASYYFKDNPQGYYPPDKRFQSYYRVTTQSFADGSSVQYTPTLANKWAPEASGFWDWPEYISSMQVVKPGNATTTYNFVDQVDDHDGPVSVTNALGATTSNTYSATAALLSTTLPEGNRTAFSYDVRGNLLSSTRYPKPGSSDAAQTESYAYGAGPTVTTAGCPNQLICNRPFAHIDARGFETDYGWDGSTGLLTSETDPADTNGLRPTTTYAYGSFSGAGSTAIRLLTTKSQQIDATQNQVTSFGYDADIKLAPNAVTVSGGGLTLRTCYKTDLVGNLISQTKPRANLGSCP